MPRPKGSKNKATLQKERRQVLSHLSDLGRDWSDIDSDLNLIYDMGKAGVKIKDIAKLYDVSRPTIYANERVIRAYNKGKAICDIEMTVQAHHRAMTGGDRQLIAYWINKLEIDATDWSDTDEKGDNYGIEIVHNDEESFEKGLKDESEDQSDTDTE